MDGYAMVEWETLGSSGHVIMCLDEIEEVVSCWNRKRNVFRVSTFFVPSGTSWKDVIERFDEHYEETFDERANEALDRMLAGTGLS